MKEAAATAAGDVVVMVMTRMTDINTDNEENDTIQPPLPCRLVPRWNTTAFLMESDMVISWLGVFLSFLVVGVDDEQKCQFERVGMNRITG
jgi:hypothetical protein